MLTDIKIKSLKPRAKLYRVADQGGLCIEVTPSGSKLWRYRHRIHGKYTMVSFGNWPEVSLAAARRKHAEARQSVKAGTSLATARQAAKAQAALAAANTFEAVKEEWLGKNRTRYAASTLRQIARHLDTILPAWFRSRPIREITPADMLEVLRPIEERGHVQTAHTVRQRCGLVFRYAIATRRIDRDPTQDIRGALPPIVVRFQSALTDPVAIGKLLRAIDGYVGFPTTRAALKLAPILFPRPANLRAMEWSEIDFDGAVWTIPADKMKKAGGTRLEHLTPLPTQALEILRGLRALAKDGDRFVFPNTQRPGKCMSGSTITMALRALGYDGETQTGHGFRATASTRLNEMGWREDVIERQLAHVPRNKVRRAYNRAEYMDERIQMMQAWADYLDGLRTAPNKVTPIRARKTA